MIKRVLLVVVCLMTVLSLAALPAAAQAEKGDKELLFNAIVITGWSGGETSTFGVVNGQIGYYFTDHVDAGVGMTLTFSGGFEGGGTEVSVGLNAFARYNFTTSGKAVPYVGVDYFMFDANEPVDLSFIRPNVGFKYFFTRNVALDLNVGFSRNYFANGPDIFKVNAIDQRVGITYVF